MSARFRPIAERAPRREPRPRYHERCSWRRCHQSPADAPMTCQEWLDVMESLDERIGG